MFRFVALCPLRCMLIAQRHMHDGAWICFNASEIVYIHNHTHTYIILYHITILCYYCILLTLLYHLFNIHRLYLKHFFLSSRRCLKGGKGHTHEWLECEGWWTEKITNGSLWGSITSAGKGRMSGEKRWTYSPRSRHLPASYSVATYIVLQCPAYLQRSCMCRCLWCQVCYEDGE